jgi:hypothetical protein
MDNTKECNTSMECDMIEYQGYYFYKYTYKHRCLLTLTLQTDKLDYWKALIDLDEEFPI